MGSHRDSVRLEVGSSGLSNYSVTALRQSGWESVFVNAQLGVITAHMTRTDIVLGCSWSYQYGATIEWQEADDGVIADILVTENSYDWTDGECKAEHQKLVKTLMNCGQLPEPKQSGASWAKESELESVGYIDEYFEGHNLILGKSAGGILRLPAADTFKHALVCGPTGSGKTSGLFIPNLIERIDSSAIVTEATGSKGRADLFEKTAGYRASHGHKIYYFNPSDLTSNRINPLDQVESLADAARVAEIIMQSTTVATHKGDQTWEMSERLLLKALIVHSVGEREQGNCNLGYVRDLVYGGAEEIEQSFEQTKIEEAYELFSGFARNTTESYRNLVLQGLATRLSLWSDPAIRALTETSDVERQTLEEELFTWYLSTAADKPELKPLSALILNSALEDTKGVKIKLSLFLDEFTNFGYVRGMPQKLTIMRHDRVPVLLGIQDYIQLELLYGKEAQLFMSQPGTRIFFRPNDLTTAERISKALGVQETTEIQVKSSGQLDDVKEKRPLLSAEELMALQEGQMIIFTPRTNPVKMQSFTWQDYSEHTQIARPDRFALPVDRTFRRRENISNQKKVNDAKPESISFTRELIGGW